MSTSTLKPKSIKQVKKVVKPTSFYLRILSRHQSVSDLRDSILVKKLKAVYRHGSTTEGNFEYEINSVESIKISADKKLMKEAFDRAEVRHSKWIHLLKYEKNKEEWNKFIKDLDFGSDKESWLIVKNRWGSRGVGNTLVKTKEDLEKILKEKAKSLDNYIVEEYKNYSVEYRIHVTEEGYFYTCRKMLKKNTPKNERFQRHDDNCSWFVESNPEFNKPENWNEIIEDCKNALKTIGADVLGFDVRCTSVKNAKDKKCRWIVIESCSAPSMGEITTEKYKEELPKILYRKYNV